MPNHPPDRCVDGTLPEVPVADQGNAEQRVPDAEEFVRPGGAARELWDELPAASATASAVGPPPQPCEVRPLSREPGSTRRILDFPARSAPHTPPSAHRGFSSTDAAQRRLRPVSRPLERCPEFVESIGPIVCVRRGDRSSSAASSAMVIGSPPMPHRWLTMRRCRSGRSSSAAFNSSVCSCSSASELRVGALRGRRRRSARESRRAGRARRARPARARRSGRSSTAATDRPVAAASCAGVGALPAASAASLASASSIARRRSTTCLGSRIKRAWSVRALRIARRMRKRA